MSRFMCTKCLAVYDAWTQCRTPNCTDGEMRPYDGPPKLYLFRCEQRGCSYEPKLPIEGGVCPLGHGRLIRVAED